MGRLSWRNAVPPVCLTSEFAIVRTGLVASTRQDNYIPLKIGLTQIPEEGLQLDGNIAAADLHFSQGESITFSHPGTPAGTVDENSRTSVFSGPDRWDDDPPL